jgi:hypothetical protein
MMALNIGWFRRTFTDESEEETVSYIQGLESRYLLRNKQEYEGAEILSNPNPLHTHKSVGLNNSISN